MEYISLSLSALSLILIIILLIKSFKHNSDSHLSRLESDVSDLKRLVSDSNNEIHKTQGLLESETRLLTQIQSDSTSNIKMIADMSNQIRTANDTNTKNMREEMSKSIQAMNDSVEKKLNEIKGVVDEKLQTNLDRKLKESFQQVVEHLSTLQKGIGEVQALSSNVTDLKKTLSSVKTRGIWGEIQLQSILDQTLTTDQYKQNVVTVPGSRDAVEFAIILPGEGDKHVWLPIDSKFPGDSYNALVDAYEGGDKADIEEKKKLLERVLLSEAKDIRDKYLHVPDTTEFGIMFVPVEGLYAEAVRMGMVEKLQEVKIALCGPTTITAYLNSLKMGFRTLAIQKRSEEVWNILAKVKTEFMKYQSCLVAAQKKIQAAEREIDTLVTTRTNMMERSLRAIETSDSVEIEGQIGEGIETE